MSATQNLQAGTLLGRVTAHGSRWPMVLIWAAAVVFPAGLWAQTQTGEPAEKLPLAALKAAIIRKNIFRPARVPPPSSTAVPSKPETILSVAPGPKRLKRPFKLLGIEQRAGESPRAMLHRNNPSEDVVVGVNDTVEFVRILEIHPTYIRCDYDGREVRIDVGETSDDAYARLMGLGSKYYLVGTTVKPQSRTARFYFPDEDRERIVEEGDVLGNARVIKIEHGRVLMEHEDGYQFPIRPSTAPRP